jgi:hypothetical protein
VKCPMDGAETSPGPARPKRSVCFRPIAPHTVACCRSSLKASSGLARLEERRIGDFRRSRFSARGIDLADGGADVATFLPRRRTARVGHDGLMESEHAETSLRPRGVRGALADKPAAGRRAPALVPTVRKLKAKGYLTHRALAEKLNRRGVPAPRGGRWQATTVLMMLARLGLIALGNGRRNSKLAARRAADARAEALAATIRKLREEGVVSLGAIARALDKRRLRPARGGKWHRSSVSQLLRRLERLDR